jgi:hypothetical protein
VDEPARVPWHLGYPGCGAAVKLGPGGSFRNCHGVVVYAGLVLQRCTVRRQLECWLSFACAEHVTQIDAARPMLERDHETRREWGRQRELASAGRRYEPAKPLATGPGAKVLHERALAWAAATTPEADR